MLIKIIGSIVAILVIAVVIVAVGMWRGFIPLPGPLLMLLAGAKEPEYSARYYPADTLAYAWVTLTPGQGQFEDMQDIWERFNEFRAFRRFTDELQDDLETESGIDLAADVAPWIGPELSAGFIDFDARRDEPIIAATVGVRDAAAARAFLDQWLEYMEDTEGADFDRDSYRDFDLWIDADQYQVYGLSRNLLVLATTESGLRELIDGVAGEIDRSLADNAKFQAAQAALPERRFVSVYIDYQEALELTEDFYPDELGAMSSGAPYIQEVEWVAIAGAWLDRAIRIELVTPAGIEYPLQVADLSAPARLLPDDTVGFTAGTFDPDIDHWRAVLRSHDLADALPYPDLIDEINSGVAEIASGNPPELRRRDSWAEGLDLAIWLVEDLTDIRLEEDLFDHLGGELILAVSDMDFRRIEDDPAANAINAVAMLSYRADGEEAVADTMDTVTDLIEDNLGGLVEVDNVNVGADTDATVFDISPAVGETDYAPGYVLHDGYLTIGTTEDALETTVALQQGDASSLASASEYERATGHLPEPRQFLAYLNINRIIRQLEPDDLEMTRDEFEILEQGFSMITVSNDSPHCRPPENENDCPVEGNAVTRVSAVLTLFPE